MHEAEAWRVIFAKDLAMMEECDLVIADLTPFRGASADAGTLVELGWFLGRGRPGLRLLQQRGSPSNARSQAQTMAVPDPMPGLTVKGFGLADNLMISGALLATAGFEMVLPEDGRDRPFDGLEVFERCVGLAARKLGLA